VPVKYWKGALEAVKYWKGALVGCPGRWKGGALLFMLPLLQMLDIRLNPFQSLPPSLVAMRGLQELCVNPGLDLMPPVLHLMLRGVVVTTASSLAPINMFTPPRREFELAGSQRYLPPFLQYNNVSLLPPRQENHA
jgi:hypothetical protein